MLKLTAAQIAESVSGELHGPADVVISGVASLQKAGNEELSYLRDEKLLDAAAASGAGAIISPCPVPGYKGALIICKDPELAFCRVLTRFAEDRLHRPTGVSALASVSDKATLGRNVAVGQFSVIEDDAVVGDDVVIYPLVYVGKGAKIGDRTVLYPQVSVLDGVEIGSDCVIHCNVVIGEDGFGYIQRDGRHIRLPHLGGVRIGNDVEIGSLVCIHRAMLDETVVENGVKIDSHSHLAHNTHVGAHSLLVAYAKLAGSVTLGKGVLLAEDVGINDHVTVGDGAIVAGGAGVRKDVAPGQMVQGYPARPIHEQRRIYALEGKLPQMFKRLRELERQVDLLRSMLENNCKDRQPEE